DKWARWSPDGRKIAFISDSSGEEEVYILDALGAGKPEQLTSGGKAMRYAPEWSPDGKRLAFADKNRNLYVLTVADKKLTLAAHDDRREVRDFAWSPGSDYLALSMTDPNNFRSIWIWGVGDAKLHRVTGEQYNEYGPAWDPKGDYLYFMAARSFLPQFDAIDFNFALDRNIGLYAMALRKDVAHPFPPEEDKVTVGDEKKDGDAAKKDAGEKSGEKKDDKKDDKKKDAGPVATKIDFEGLASRVARVPVPFDNYDGLSTAEGKLLYVKFAAQGLGEPASQPSLQIFTFKDRKAATVTEGINGYDLSRDGEKVLVIQSGQYNLYDAKPEAKDSKKTIDTGGMMVNRVPAEEWAEIFREVR